MSDTGDIYREIREAEKLGRHEDHNTAVCYDWSFRWEIITEWYWRVRVGKRFVEYWPSTEKLRYADKLLRRMDCEKVERFVNNLRQPKGRALTIDHVMPFGKYRGEPIIDILENDAQYLLWCIGNIEKFEITSELEALIHRSAR